MSASQVPWILALAAAAALSAFVSTWREGQADFPPPATALVRFAAPIDGSAAAERPGFAGGSDLAALEATVDHTGPAGADFWSAHGVTAPKAGEGAGAIDPNERVTLRFRDLVLPDYDSEIRGPDGNRPPREAIFPPAVLALDGRLVALEGFVQPIEARGRKIVLFAMLPFPPSCLFGGMLRPDQQIEASAEALGGLELHPYLPIRVEGRLSVGEEMDSFGFVRSLFRLEVTSATRL
ncbi:MAG: hypothetical protein GC161_08910 [Planctomycetaceae bacterium]|nr:hypothetical protein [Planctomycetaceae bacterium]